MRKVLFDLQLFAEEAATSATNATETKPTETDAKVTSEEKPDGKTKAAAKYTDEDVDKMKIRWKNEWKEQQQRAVDEAKKLAEMNAQQKAEYERDQLKKELDELKRKDSLAEMTKTARKMLSESGISASDELLTLLVTTDAEQTKAAIDSFSKLFKDEVEKAVKEKLRGETPRKGVGSVPAMTKEQIMAIQDPELRQKKMLEYRHLFNI